MTTKILLCILGVVTVPACILLFLFGAKFLLPNYAGWGGYSIVMALLVSILLAIGIRKQNRFFSNGIWIALVMVLILLVFLLSISRW